MKAYEDAINETSTEKAPWYVIPADKKWFTRIAISTIMLEVLESLNLKYPVLPEEEMKALEKVKKELK
jgi:polyphosphate kinase 2 (PPK2 family)